MSNKTLLYVCEVTINFALNRISKLDGQNKKAIEGEFREWIDAIEKYDKDYEILYLNHIKQWQRMV